jgi:two-component sensor histidine kinase
MMTGERVMGLRRAIDVQMADVFITGELKSRPAGKPDYLREKLALQELTSRMADEPEAVLPRFVDLAMELTGGLAAGLSLLEESPAPGVFRWKYLRGILSRFEGAATPRNFSPCGITLDENQPTLCVHPERAYGWIADANIVVPELLLVPLFLGGKVALGTLWVVADREGHFDGGHARLASELAAFVSIALRMLESEQRLKRALDEQETLAREMSHRVKNLFATTDALIRITARGSATKEEMAEKLSGRLHAMADAHALVRRSFNNSDVEQRGSDLEGLIRTIIRPHEGSPDGRRTRFSAEGPSVPLGDHATNGVALVIHELATNATKYGALTADDGEVALRWECDEDKLVLHWVERGGPPVETPSTAPGFGSVLMDNTVARQFDGTIVHEWEPEGLSVTISLPLANLSR